MLKGNHKGKKGRNQCISGGGSGGNSGRSKATSLSIGKSGISSAGNSVKSGSKVGDHLKTGASGNKHASSSKPESVQKV